MKKETEREKFDRYWLKRQRDRGFGGYLSDAEMLANFDRRKDEFHAWCAALEAKQAEVKMPEPTAVVHAKLGTTCMIPGASIRKGDKLYTEQQLRTLLAQHGINIAD